MQHQQQFLKKEGMVTMPADKAQAQKNKEISEKYKDLLYPEGNLVAVKLIQDTQGWEKVKRPNRPLALCQFISQTRYIGRTVLIKAEDISCYAPAENLFGVKMPADAPSRYVGWQFSNEEAAKKSIEVIPHLEAGRYKAVYLGPLDRCPVDPDVIIFFGNAAQMQVLISAYLRDRGGALNFNAGNQLGCASAIVVPMKEKRPNLVIPGNAVKLLALPSNTDMFMGIPGFLLGEMADNATKLRETGGSRYPVPWAYISWVPQPPIADLLKREGGGPSWLKR
jgi:uncharacterized protein (DUF169 family)